MLPKSSKPDDPAPAKNSVELQAFSSKSWFDFIPGLSSGKEGRVAPCIQVRVVCASNSTRWTSAWSSPVELAGSSNGVSLRLPIVHSSKDIAAHVALNGTIARVDSHTDANLGTITTVLTCQFAPEVGISSDPLGGSSRPGSQSPPHPMVLSHSNPKRPTPASGAGSDAASSSSSSSSIGSNSSSSISKKLAALEVDIPHRIVENQTDGWFLVAPVIPGEPVQDQAQASLSLTAKEFPLPVIVAPRSRTYIGQSSSSPQDFRYLHIWPAHSCAPVSTPDRMANIVELAGNVLEERRLQYVSVPGSYESCDAGISLYPDQTILLQQKDGPLVVPSVFHLNIAF